jgi:dihydroxy-acid dehydratase
VSERRLDLILSEAELAERRAAYRPVAPQARRGYARLYLQSVLQAELGCDFDFLRKA